MSDMYFKSLPDTSTPLIPSNLDKLNDIKVSPTQPETNEKVWIQKGKNLISPSNIFKGYDIEENTTDLTVYGNGLTTGWIQVLPNTTYTLSGGNRCRFQFKNDNGVVTYGGANATNPYSFTTLADTKYVRIYFYDYYNASITYPELPEVQLEQGSTATEYEAYIEPNIWCKNDNGVFEECKLKNDYSNLILIKQQSDNTELTLDGNAAVFRNPYHEEIAGYTFVGTVTGYGNGNAGLLVSGNGWCFNSQRSSQTWTSITWVNFFVKK